MIEVDNHNILAGIGQDNTDVLVCIKAKDDWRICQYYPSMKTCPICGESIKE